MAYYALKKDVFDINKVTVVGSPTITSDGVASGFSVNDYLTANVNINSSNFDIDFEFTLPNVASGGQYAFRFNNSSNTRFVVTNAKIFMYDNTNLELCSYTYTNNYNVGDLIKAKVKATSSGITLNLLNKTKNTTVTVSSSKVQNIDASLITFGRSATTVATDIFTGSIYLPSFKIYVDNQLVFQPVKPAYLLERRKEGYDSSKFTVVGTPTITSNGVASGFNSGNKIQAGVFYGEVFQYEFTAKIGSFTAGVTQYLCQGFKDPTNLSSNLLIANTNKLWLVAFTEDSVYTNVGSYIISENTEYNIKAIYSKTNVEYYVNNTLVASIAGNFKVPTSMTFGTAGANAFQGSINLPSTSITVDGKEVFTGAKENYYMLNGI